MPEPPPFDYRPASADLEWRDAAPYSRRFADSYYSSGGGLAESRHVFIDGNDLIRRWRERRRAGALTFIIAETGFGTGLNFLATWQAWQAEAGPEDRLCYIATEAYPLSATEIRRAIARWPELATLCDALATALPARINGNHRLHLDDGRVCLDLCYGESTERLRQCLDGDSQALQNSDRRGVDAWFLDGFSPAVNPEHWHAALCGVVAQLSAADATCASFTAAGHVRRALSDAGFDVEKAAGFGRKRHMTRGKFRAATTNNRERLRWHRPPSRRNARTALVIGAGLAGCSTAAALARRGLEVTVIDSAAQPASAASAVPASLLYTKLSPAPGTMNLFTLHSFLYALRHCDFDFNSGSLSQQRGVMQLMHTDKLHTHFGELQSRIEDCEWLRFLSAAQASEVAGLPIQHPALLFPTAGRIDISQYCAACMNDARINFQPHTTATTLQFSDNIWQVKTESDIALHADIVVIANATAAKAFAQTAWLPLRAMRGQVSMLQRDSATAIPALPVCHEGYVIDTGDALIAGASFVPNDSSTEIRDSEHQSVLAALAEALPAIGKVETLQVMGGFAGIRCASPDYLPMIGAVPDAAAFAADYQQLGFDANLSIPTAGRYLSGLYVNVAHGSRGLSSAPIAAELIAAQIFGEPRPLATALCQAVSPARFLIRGLKRKTYRGASSLPSTTSSVSETGLDIK